MAVTENDVKFYKSETITDGASNGGRMSYVEVPNNVKHNLFPRVTKSERENGVTRYRKEFWANRNASNEVAYGLLLAIITPSNGDDRFYIKAGTQVDTQGDLTEEGCVFGDILKRMSREHLFAEMPLERLDFQETRQIACLLYTSPSPRDLSTSRMPSSA